MNRTADLPRALRRIGIFWWIWIAFGLVGNITFNGRPFWVSQLALVALNIWVTALAGATLCIEIITLFFLDGSNFEKSVFGAGVIVVFVGYVLTLARFSASLPGSTDVVAIWRIALRALTVAAFGLLTASASEGCRLLLHQTSGPTVWSTGIGFGVSCFFFAYMVAVVMTASATSLTRKGFEPR